MRYVRLPETNLNVSVISLGVAAHGTQVNEPDSFSLFDTYLEQGGNFFDTAHIYAAWVEGGWGEPERLLGRWVKQRNNRDKVVIATKGGHPHLNSMHQSRLSRAEILQDLDESLERLQMESVDVYWLHRDDVNRPIADIAETLQIAISSKKIRFFGVSNWSFFRIRELKANLAAQNLTGFVGSQIGWSLAQRNPNVGGDPTVQFMDSETLSYHRESGIFVAAYSSQANGFFAGAYGREIPNPTPKSGRSVVHSYYRESNFQRLDRAKQLGEKYGVSANSIALAYITSQSFPASAIVSCPTSEYLSATLSAGDTQLTPEECDWLLQG